LLIAQAGSAQVADPEGHQRAGFPLEVAPWAHPSDTGRYVGYMVGGGAAVYHGSEPPGPEDGTWGWDFTGGIFKRRVIHNWWNGRFYQGGVGAYGTEHYKIFVPKE
jgi:hypothetical protein